MIKFLLMITLLNCSITYNMDKKNKSPQIKKLSPTNSPRSSDRRRSMTPDLLKKSSSKDHLEVRRGSQGSPNLTAFCEALKNIQNSPGNQSAGSHSPTPPNSPRRKNKNKSPLPSTMQSERKDSPRPGNDPSRDIIVLSPVLQHIDLSSRKELPKNLSQPLLPLQRILKSSEEQKRGN